MKKIILIPLVIVLVILIIMVGIHSVLLLAQKINPLSLDIMYYYKYDMKIKMADWNDDEERFQIDKNNYLFVIDYKKYNKTLKRNKFQNINKMNYDKLNEILINDQTINNDLEVRNMIIDFFSTSTHFIYKEKNESKILILYNNKENKMLILEINNE